MIASAVAAEALVLVDANGPIRGLVVGWFLVVCPGLSVILAAGIGDRLMTVILSIAISLALALSLATAMVLLGTWSPLAELTVLAAGTVIVASVGASRVRHPE